MVHSSNVGAIRVGLGLGQERFYRYIRRLGFGERSGVTLPGEAQGKLRRFMSANFRKQEVRESLSLRRGECNRCGACCEILFKCPFLKKHTGGTTTCGIYEDRPNQCRLFPIEKRDLEEVRGTCSFYFIEKPVKLERAS